MRFEFESLLEEFSFTGINVFSKRIITLYMSVNVGIEVRKNNNINRYLVCVEVKRNLRMKYKIGI